ncbi:MAG: ZIP family metal transporter [Bacteroidia bacterium]
MAILVTTILFFVVFFSGLALFVLKKADKQYVKLLIAFSGAYLLALVILHLLPEIYEHNVNNIGYYILGGFLLQILLEFFSEGLEHGHIHHHGHKLPYAMFISLCIHSFIEAMPLSGGWHIENSDTAVEHIHTYTADIITKPMLIGIVLHKIPITLILMTMLMNVHASKTKSILWLLIFATMAPLGAFTSWGLIQLSVAPGNEFYTQLLGIVCGIFLHVSTTILFESTENHRFSMYKFFTIIIGIILAIITIP